MSVVKMEVFVYNQYERQVMDHALTIIEAAREEQMRALKGNVPPGMRQDPSPTERPVSPEEETATPVTPAEGKVVGTITPKPEAPAISETEMAAVVQKSLDTRGLAETRELIAPITGGKRWRESDPSVWPDIKAVLEK